MIYAAKLLLEKDIPFIFYLLGPDTEEPEYAQECRDLIQQLGLKEHVIMTGRVNIKDYLKQTDILVLTSISEGQPLAMLEGMASGLPWVVTDVGSCKELIYGQDEDPYGQCGFVVPPVSPEQVATHLEWYYRHPESIQQFGNNGRNRIEAYYQLSGVVDSYRALFRKGCENMAGIGFRLQKLFQEDYYSSRVKAYGFSLFVTAGPWLVVILAVTTIRFILSLFHSISIEEQRLFTISISYCFIFLKLFTEHCSSL